MKASQQISKNDFKTWILEHQNLDYEINLTNDGIIEISTDYGKATINFTEIEEYTIVEFNIISNKDHSVKFYLHFELNDENHAKQLYDEMIETLLELKNEKIVRVLLSCSAGLTTSMFAENLNSVVDMLGMDYHFNAVSYLNIYEEVENYDVVLLAPQIGYMFNRLKESIPNKLVLQIPTAVFASYDALSAIKFVQDELESFNMTKNKKNKDECTRCYKQDKRILSIVIAISQTKTRIHYRLIDRSQIIDSNMIIKPSMNIEDLYDIIDTLLLKHQYIDVIGIATPGIVQDNKQLKIPSNSLLIDIPNDFENKYHCKVFVLNNANAAVVGFSLEHPEYQNIIFHSQPLGFGVGGQGVLLNGQVIRGLNGISGEIRFFLRRMQLSDEPHKLAQTKHGTIEIITKALLPTVSITGPEAIAIYAPMIKEVNEIKNALTSFLSEEFLPEFYIIQEPSSYMLSGITKLCVDYLKKSK